MYEERFRKIFDESVARIPSRVAKFSKDNFRDYEYDLRLRKYPYMKEFQVQYEKWITSGDAAKSFHGWMCDFIRLTQRNIDTLQMKFKFDSYDYDHRFKVLISDQMVKDFFDLAGLDFNDEVSEITDSLKSFIERVMEKLSEWLADPEKASFLLL